MRKGITTAAKKRGVRRFAVYSWDREAAKTPKDEIVSAILPAMDKGEVIAGRFEIECLAGSGGMGQVFRARDRSSGEAVAVKVLHGEHGNAARFLREAEVLAELSHPGIVRHVAHGVAGAGEVFIAMEWLEGEDLAERLRRARLTVDETVTLVARTVDALAAVHARGIVHRDLKPSNLFLVGGNVAEVKLLDFGIAWRPSRTRMTQTGALVGTPGYMAPEQARSEEQLDARVDVFALGCVLFECLSGRPAFSGDHFVAILGKILSDEVPRLSEIEPGTPPALDTLCARMLAKHPEERPRDGAEVAVALDAVGLGATLSLPEAREQAGVPLQVLTQRERRVLSVVLMGREPPREGASPVDVETQPVSTLDELRREMKARGGHLEPLADGSMMVTVVGAGVATDQAAQAARCAFALRAMLEGRPVAVSTGRAEVSGKLLAGVVIDRAAQMLAERGAAPEACCTAPIAIDEATAGLLDDRFEVIETDAGLWLRGEQAVGAGAARRLMGKRTACVGRDVELGTLTASFAVCVEESTARAVLLTAPAGMGKTRLAQELLGRVQQRGEPFACWIGRGEPLRAGAAFGLLGQVLGGALGIQDGEPLAERRDKLLGRVAARVRAEDARRVAEFLGEIMGTPFPDEDSVPLCAARKDAQLMGDQMRRAWVDFLGAWCAVEPVLLMLEDVHWGDLPSVQLIDEALRRLKDEPWMVLGMARPEVHERFPRLWAERKVQEIRLGELSRKASARLVRQVIGEKVGVETVERLVGQADGNAFTLEELIRAVAEGRREALPETVLSMLQCRLEALDPRARRVLRAASVFGQTFWRGAVEALLGGGTGVPVLGESLDELERREWIHARSSAKFQGERELCFRHALVREAAYGMLTDDDRALGHRLAGAWLERMGEPSAAVIAEHFERGGEPARAIGCYQRAAAQALAANDFGAVLSWTERALALEAEDAMRGELSLLRVEALLWRGDNAEADRWAREAMAVLPRGSAAWYAAAYKVGHVAIKLGQIERLATLADVLASTWSEQEPTCPAVAALARMAFALFVAGLPDRAESLLTRIEAVAERFRGDPTIEALILRVQMMQARFAGHLGRMRALAEAVVRCHEQAGNLRDACVARSNLGFMECLLGAYAEAVVVLRAVCADAERMSLKSTLANAQNNLGLALLGSGAFGEARVVEERAVAVFAEQRDRRLEGGSREYLARILLRTGELDAAEAEARRAVELAEGAKPLQIVARGTLANVLRARGRPAEALAEAREAMALRASIGKVEEGEALVLLSHADALFATGDHAAARAAIAEARDHLLAEAARIDDPSRRKTFLENVPENARTLELAQAWLGEPDPALP